MDAEIAKELKTDINVIRKTIYEGNGQPSMIAQIAEIKGDQKAMSEHLDQQDKNFDRHKKDMSYRLDRIDRGLEKGSRFRYVLVGAFLVMQLLLELFGSTVIKAITHTSSVQFLHSQSNSNLASNRSNQISETE